ncbi:MAG: cytochrome C [Algoriphagus sp.]|uniref:c-type cytochrome n=1 Tax=Algoriphagus sp. TaxID=1872435 RepID=UPI002730AC22|nr:c-type cytochrome [Algoriphagus sp.]MDP2039574.1 cytochrome C [Algoriphagus sp.]MDP3470406.1 cytochrome C [Algoriphagus sp.]
MKPKTYLVKILLLLLVFSCNSKSSELELEQNSKPKAKEFFVVPGEDEIIEPEIIKKGEVLVAYSDCYHCHKEEGKFKGPSFADIARRYPMQQAYIDLLARKIISGGSGTWGYPVMSSHPKLSLEDAKIMVTYILSLEKSKS